MRSFFYNVTRARLDGRRLEFGFTCPVRRCSGRLVLRDARGPLGSRRYAVLGRDFGGKPEVPISIPLERKPAGRRPELLIFVQSFARDSFRLLLG